MVSTDALLPKNVVLRQSLWCEDRILTQLVMERGKLVDFASTNFTIKHTERVVSIALAGCCHVLMTAYISCRSLFEAIVGQIVYLGFVRNEILQLTLLKFGRSMRSVGHFHLLSRTHI